MLTMTICHGVRKTKTIFELPGGNIMKKLKFGRRTVAFVLVLSMVLGMSATTCAAVEDFFAEDTIHYVSLGASNVNGYGLDGYLPEGITAANKNTANVFGYKRCPEGSYVDLVRDALTENGYTVDVDQLAISSMRVEELRVLLDETYDGDAYTAWRFTGPGKWFENAVTGGLEALRADYVDSIENADLITIDIGVNNFGVYLSNQLASGGTYYDDDLSLVDPAFAEQYNNAKTYVYTLIAEHAGEYADAVSELEYVVDAMAYAFAGFCVNFDIVMEKIYALNPDATVVAVSIQNLMEGLEATIPGVDGTVPFGELFGALVDAANLYIAIGSAYSDDYLFADVSENGRVEFFLDQLLTYNGNPASLDKDMKDCFDVYDDDLMLSSKIDGISTLTEEQKPGAKTMAYDVVAEIMQLGAKNNVLDLGVVLAGGYGSVEAGLLGAIEDEVLGAITNLVLSPTFEYSIDENFFNNIAVANGAEPALVNTVATLGIRTGIGNSFYGHPNRNGHAQIKNAIINALESNISGLDVVKNRFGITEEDEAAVNEIIAEMQEIMHVVQNGTREEKEDMICGYLDILKAELSLTEEEEAKIDEFIATVTELAEIVKNTSSQEAKAEIDAYIAELQAKAANIFKKIGHKHYTLDEDGWYVAIGGDTVTASNITNENNKYHNLLAKEPTIPDNKTAMAKSKLLPSQVYDFITTEAATEIKKADLITYETDASSFIYAALSETPAWNKYIDAETLDLIYMVWAKIEEVLTSDWKTAGAEAFSCAAEKIKTEVMKNMPAGTITEGKIDAILELSMPFVQTVIELTANEKDALVSEVMSIDKTLLDIAEKLVYTVVAYTVDTIKAIEAIQTINPDATVVVAGMYNPVRGLQIVTDNGTIQAGEMFEYVVTAANLYYAGYAAENDGFIFVDISETPTTGFAEAMDMSTLSFKQITDMVLEADGNMHANTEGHAYIAEKIVNALTCDYEYEKLDADNHKAKCSICGYEKTEAHDFGGTTTCTKCGYEQEVSEEPDPTPTPTPTPDPEPTPTPGSKPSSKPSSGSSGGGGSISTKFTVQFETNGGSAIEKVEVKKGEVLVAPKNPTKAGFAFAGWYTDKALTAKYDFNTPVTKSFTLYAKWVKEDIFSKFTDINKDAWYYDYVKAIVEKGLMNGISETEFAPEKTLTRGMFVTILHRVEGEPKSEKGANFKDVAAGQYYENAVKWASENGIVNGISETEFAPDAEVTRQQMAAMLARYAAYKKIEVPAEGDVTYTDSDQIAEYAKDAVNIAKKLGILIGNEDGSFAPERNATRAEAATLFVRLLDAFEKVK